MVRMRWASLLVILMLFCSVIPTGRVQAARGVPGSPEFGYGASLQVNGPYLDQAFFLAGSMRLDWLAIDVSWRTIEPENGAPANWSAIEPVMRQAAQQRIAVLLRLVEAPAWAFNDRGPDASQVIRFLTDITSRYSGVVQAIELFPAANTISGWGMQPDPSAYAALFATVQNGIANQSILLVAAGLRPMEPGGAGMDDLQFLQGLYDAGLRPFMPVVGVDLSDLSGDPLTPPSSSQPRSLRHYELVRQLMQQNGHASGLIWITRLGLASGTIDSATSQAMSLQQQTDWLHQAAMQIRSQLYIGVTVFQSLNPASAEASPSGNYALILGNAEYHPFYPLLKAFIDQNNPDPQVGRPGRPKDIALIKASPKDA